MGPYLHGYDGLMWALMNTLHGCPLLKQVYTVYCRGLLSDSIRDRPRTYDEKMQRIDATL